MTTATKTTKIGVLGAGSVGGALGRGWAKAGYDVRFAVRGGSERSDARLAGLLAETGATSGTVAEVAARADVLLLAVPWDAAEAVLASAGDLAGKVILDATNPLAPSLSGLLPQPAGSGGEQVAVWARGARVVKIFNSTGAENMADPRYAEGAAAMLYAGDDAEAKGIAHELAAALGFEPQDVGPLAAAALLESAALLWITLAYPRGLGRGIAFRLMRR